ncbi:hypothetical protein C1E23_16215 [Pseudoalteromonas phenolica]|uniref:Uncharacterized protein n=1 Tax=Pseudoalteromonas phenolica TaxID=161398 RepID=A0A4Q7IJQ5_9GAMM|nr:hypothetical protein C1E23_16215 [Pseudoalteromonas phenolica]
MVQTERQISITQNNNTANNYYMHKREFSFLCENIEKEFKLKIDKQAAYSFLFPLNNANYVEFNVTSKHKFLTLLMMLMNYFLSTKMKTHQKKLFIVCLFIHIYSAKIWVLTPTVIGQE